MLTKVAHLLHYLNKKIKPYKEHYSQYMIRNRYLITFYFDNVFMRPLRITIPRTPQAATCTLEAMVMKVITYQWVPRRIADIFEDRKTWRHLCWRALSWTGFNVPPWCRAVSLCQLTTRRRRQKAITIQFIDDFQNTSVTRVAFLTTSKYLLEF